MTYFIARAEPAHVAPGQGFRLDGINYPAGWLDKATEAEKARLGALPAPEIDPARQRAVPTDTGWRIRDIPRAERLARQTENARAACRERILSTIGRNAQMNLASMAASGRLSPAEAATYGHILDWIHAMRAACHTISGDLRFSPQSEAVWPGLDDDVHDAALELIARY